ncbi:MAG: hypothetical protein JNL74_15695 [Fibrobacteres bacterium]|nr:hypothetical protein [Fibrobacterota bacterium]
MKVSAEADKKLKSMMALPENSGKEARVVVSGFSCCGPKFAIVFEPKTANDIEVKQTGYSIIYEKRISGFMDDASVEFKETWSGEPAFTVEVQEQGGSCCG